MLRGSVTASLIGYLSLMHVKEFGQLLIEISSLLVKISRGLYYERMKLSYLYRQQSTRTVLLRKMLKRVADIRYPCQTPTVVFDSCPVVPFN